MCRQNSNSFPRVILIVVFSILFATGTDGLAAGRHAGGHGHGDELYIGRLGQVPEVTRTITITMLDTRYLPEKIAVRRGETIRFIVMNKGEFVHEFNIGTAGMHAAHRKEMMKMFQHGALEPDDINRDSMKMPMTDGTTVVHNDPNSVLLGPEKSREIIWKFDTDAELEFACNVPGHYESGMVGKISIH